VVAALNLLTSAGGLCGIRPLTADLVPDGLPGMGSTHRSVRREKGLVLAAGRWQLAAGRLLLGNLEPDTCNLEPAPVGLDIFRRQMS
jgi:hypothetical protein